MRKQEGAALRPPSSQTSMLYRAAAQYSIDKSCIQPHSARIPPHRLLPPRWPRPSPLYHPPVSLVLRVKPPPLPPLPCTPPPPAQGDQRGKRMVVVVVVVLGVGGVNPTRRQPCRQAGGGAQRGRSEGGREGRGAHPGRGAPLFCRPVARLQQWP